MDEILLKCILGRWNRLRTRKQSNTAYPRFIFIPVICKRMVREILHETFSTRQTFRNHYLSCHFLSRTDVAAHLVVLAVVLLVGATLLKNLRLYHFKSDRENLAGLFFK